MSANAKLKARRHKSSHLKEKFKENLNLKNVTVALLGGALLVYAHRNRASTMGKWASVAGSSLLGRTLSNVGII